MSAAMRTDHAVTAAPGRLGADPGSTAVLVAAGLALLFVRPAIAAGPWGAWVLAGIYVAIGAASFIPAVTPQAISAPPPGGARQVGRLPVALAVGMGAFAAAVVLVRPVLHPVAGPVAVALTVLASIAEEAFFRGFLYARLAPAGAAAAVVVSAAAFALVHATAYPPAAVAVDFAAGLLFGWQRWVSGSWLAPAATHTVANLLAVTW
jgi:membrane protease YdiL (CAAX protease family)